MKYMLILYLCSFAELPIKCDNSSIIQTYPTWKECALAGYNHAFLTMQNLHLEDIEDEKLAIKFECKEMPNA